MLFGKSTICNLADFAESKNAESIIFILNRSHFQKSYYDKMFKVIDAAQLFDVNVQDLIKKDLIAKVLEVQFYKMTLWTDQSFLSWSGLIRQSLQLTYYDWPGLVKVKSTSVDKEKVYL